MQQNEMTTDKMFVIDEKVSFDGCPSSENDAVDEETVVDEDPDWTKMNVW